MSIRHQLNIHLDYGPQCSEINSLEIRYDYHFSGEHRLEEQLLRLSADLLDADLRRDLDEIYGALVRRIPAPNSVRLPHAEICPTIKPMGLTFVVQDQVRAAQLPIARLYFIEMIPELGSKTERKVYLEGPDWTVQENVVCDRVRSRVKGLAWEHYKGLVRPHLFGNEED